MKIIAIQAEKGGVGKTTLATTLASVLASEPHNKKVLLIDVDEQCNACFDYGITLTQIIMLDQDGRTSSKLFRDTHVDMEKLTLKKIVPEIPNLSLIPSTFELMFTERALQDNSHETYEPLTEEEIAELGLSHTLVPQDIKLCKKRPPKQKEALVLKETIKNNAEYLNRFDYVIFDCKPSISHINENVLMVADSLIAVTDPSYNSLYGLATLYRFWDKIMEARGLEADYVESVVLNRFKPKGIIDREIEAILTGNFDYEGIPDYAKTVFNSYSNLYVKNPVMESVKFRQRSAMCTPMVINPDKDEKRLLAEIVEPLIKKLYEEEVL